jgi:hypothetical protein
VIENGEVGRYPAIAAVSSNLVAGIGRARARCRHVAACFVGDACFHWPFTVCAAASLQSASVPIGTADPNWEHVQLT